MSGASDRLARTRLALIEYVQRKEERSQRRGPLGALGALMGRNRETPSPQVQAHEGHEGRPDAHGAGEPMPADAEPWDAARAAAASGGGGWPGGLKRAVRSWWRHHPARLGLQVATPALAAYGRQKPMQYLGIAAVAGAVFVVARPWRLISVGGLLLALARSPQLAGVLMAAMSSADEPDD